MEYPPEPTIEEQRAERERVLVEWRRKRDEIIERAKEQAAREKRDDLVVTFGYSWGIATARDLRMGDSAYYIFADGRVVLN